MPVTGSVRLKFGPQLVLRRVRRCYRPSVLLPTTLRNLDTADEVVHSLDNMPISAWQTSIDAVPARESQVMQALARLAQPEVKVVAVQLPARILRTPEDIEKYLTDVRQILEDELEDGTHLSV